MTTCHSDIPGTLVALCVFLNAKSSQFWFSWFPSSHTDYVNSEHFMSLLPLNLVDMTLQWHSITPARRQTQERNPGTETLGMRPTCGPWHKADIV